MTEHLMARSRTTIVLVAGAVAAWAVTVDRMRGMDAGPGTDLGGLGWYLGIWVTMTAAMMLPSAAPAARHVAGLARRAPTLLFTAGYLAVWTGYGLLAYGVFQLVTSLDPGWRSLPSRSSRRRCCHAARGSPRPSPSPWLPSGSGSPCRLRAFPG